MKSRHFKAILLGAVFIAGCTAAPNVVTPTTPGATGTPVLMDVLGEVPRAQYDLMATLWFPAPIDTVVPSSSGNEDFFAVDNVTDGRLNSAWRPAATDDAPHLIFNLQDTVYVDSLNIKLSLGQVSSSANQRVLVDVYVSNNGGSTWTQVVNDFRPHETTLDSVSYPATQANAVRLQFRTEGDNDISSLHVCEAVVIDPINSTPGGGSSPDPSPSSSSTPSSSPSIDPSPDPSASPSTDPSPSASPVGGGNGNGNTHNNGNGQGGGGGNGTGNEGNGNAGGNGGGSTPSPSPSATTDPGTGTGGSVDPSPTPTPVPSTDPGTGGAGGTTSCGTFNTFSQGGWSQPVGSSSVPAQYRDNNWVAIENAYGGSPGVVAVGNMSFDEPADLVAWYDTNPSGLARQVIALDLNLRRSLQLANTTADLQELVILDGPFAGDTLSEFYAKAVQALAGNYGSYSAGDFTTQAAEINLFFHYPGNSPDGVNFECP